VEKVAGSVDVDLPIWVKWCMWAWINMRITPMELLVGTPYMRVWCFVGRTDNGPRGVFGWEIAEVWLN